tara:strand:+ start:20 stop:502 length:483 start_codon:yes stop_codon:yes gene_type:complete
MKGNEAEYIIPLRKDVMKVPKFDRTKKAVIAVRGFLKKHTKSENVLLGKELNKKLQEGGRKNVCPRIHVKVLKDEDNYRAELIGFPIETAKKEEETKKGKTKEEKVEKKESEKIIEKEEIVEEKKEETNEKQLPTKQETEKSRHENIVTKTEKPKNEKKK